MTRASALVALALAALVALAAAQSVDVKTVSMKVLVLGVVPEADPTVGGIRTALDGRGMPWEYINVREGYADNEPLPLVNAGGRGNYYAIVKLSSTLAYEAREGFWPSALSDTQWAQIDQYQVDFNVRVLSVHSWPFFDGVTYMADGATQYMEFTDEARSIDQALAANARISLLGSYVTPAALVTPASLEQDQEHHFQPTGYFYHGEQTTEKDGVACAIQTNPDTGAQTWHYFFVPTHYFAGQSAAMSVGLNWATRGIFIGKRRMYLSMQIDDVFLSTGEWALEFAGNSDQTIRPQVRSTAEEMQLLKDSQEWLTTLLPDSSLIKYEWAFNGNGVALMHGCDNDHLCQKAQETVDDFWWLSHTYSHPFLDDYTFEQCRDELKQNWDAAKDIWGNPLPDAIGLHEMVNPAITGLFNGECLRAMKDQGIVTAVGDNSRAELLPDNPYHGLYTTVEKNGFDGTFIIPRWATNIFFDNSEPEYNLVHFNYITNYQYNWTWEELLDYESTTAARNLIQLRPDPFMFHQANVHSFSWPGWNHYDPSLLTLWTKGVIDELNKYNALPVRSIRQSKMREELEERMHRDACGLDAYMVLENGIATRVHATSASACRFALTGVPGNDDLEHEMYGTERTVYKDLNGHNDVVVDTGLVYRPTCPKVDGELCSGNGHCDAGTNPPKCICDTGYSGYNCSTLTLQYAGNMVANGDFQDGTASAATSWDFFGDGYTVETLDDNRFLRMHNADAHAARGAAQLITLGQQYATPVRIMGRSRPHGVSGAQDANYALYIDAVYDDGTWQYGLTAQFNPHAEGVWHEASLVFTPPKPVTYLWVYAMFRYHAGTADFDDIAVQEAADLVDDSVLSPDGRCGSQSPINAACANGECCSTFGYCGTTEDHCTYQSVDDVVEEPSKPVNFRPRNCRRCRRRSRGPCKHPSGWCTQLNKKKRTCPAGTVLCDDAPEFSRGIRPWIITALRTRGIRRRGWSRAIRRRFRRGLARAFKVQDTQVDISFVGDSVAGDDSSRVELVVVANDNESGEELAEVVHEAVTSGAVDVELAANSVGGVHAEEEDEVRVELADEDDITSGTGLIIMLSAAAVACVLGIAIGAIAMRRYVGARGYRGGVASTSRVVRLDTDDEAAAWGSPAKMGAGAGHMPVAQHSDSGKAVSILANSDSEADDPSDYSSAVEGMDRRRVSQRQLVYASSGRRTSANSRASSVGMVNEEPQLLGTPRADDVRSAAPAM